MRIGAGAEAAGRERQRAVRAWSGVAGGGLLVLACVLGTAVGCVLDRQLGLAPYGAVILAATCILAALAWVAKDAP